MASTSLVLDASVVVKWFSAADEADLEKALFIRDAHIEGSYHIIVPDMLYHEVANTLVHKSSMTVKRLTEAITTLFELQLSVFSATAERLRLAAQLARAAVITEYDAIYLIAATDSNCPLITANPKHQGKAQQLGCRVIPLKDWKSPA